MLCDLHHHGFVLPPIEFHMNGNTLNTFFGFTSLILNDWYLSFIIFFQICLFCFAIMVWYFVIYPYFFFILISNHFRVPYFIEPSTVSYYVRFLWCWFLLLVPYYSGTFPYGTVIFYCEFVFIRIVFPRRVLCILSLEVSLPYSTRMV